MLLCLWLLFSAEEVVVQVAPAAASLLVLLLILLAILLLILRTCLRFFLLGPAATCRSLCLRKAAGAGRSIHAGI